MLLRQVFLRAKFFARKKHDVRVRKPKKEKNVRFRIRIWKKRYGMFFECLGTKQNGD